MTIPEPPQPNPYQNPPAAPGTPKTPIGFAIAALIVGIVAFLSGLAPVWGLLVGLAAAALGVIALMKKQNKGLALTGLILGGIAALTSLIVTIALISGASTLRTPAADSVPDVQTSNASASPTPAPETATATPTPTPTKTQAPPAPAAPVETVSQSNAKRSAKSYLSVLAFSRSGLIKQLEYEGFSTEDATYGVDAQNANWMEQAAASAQNYLDTMAFSHSGLVDQLVYEGFSPEEAEYGVTSVGL